MRAAAAHQHIAGGPLSRQLRQPSGQLPSRAPPRGLVETSIVRITFPKTWARHTWPVVMGMGQVRARSVVREPRIRERSGYGCYPQRRCTRRPGLQHTMAVRTMQGTSPAASFPTTSRSPPCCSPRKMSRQQTPASKPRAVKRRVAQSLHGTDASPKATRDAPPALNAKP